MAARISEEKIIEINETYAELKNYAATARAVGVSAGTVKKYVKADYVRKEEVEAERTKFDLDKLKDIEDFVPINILFEDAALRYAEEELEEIKNFTKELII